MLLEAMLAGLPVVATSVSAVPEVVADGTTGILVPEGDVDGSRAALERLLDDREQAHAFGAAGRERALVGVLGRRDDGEDDRRLPRRSTRPPRQAGVAIGAR